CQQRGNRPQLTF
nr:immunoglobulin light chain junction region [Macaca mulatta]